jgi:uncharacterized protein YjbJ (UPF0337 family)
MRRSSRRDKTEGTIDRVAGRVLETFSKLTGKRSTRAKGKAARARGRGRTARGATKRRWAR